MDREQMPPNLPTRFLPPPDFFKSPEVYFPAMFLHRPEYFQMNPNLVHPLTLPQLQQAPWPPIDLRFNQNVNQSSRMNGGISGIDMSKKQRIVSQEAMQRDLSRINEETYAAYQRSLSFNEQAGTSRWLGDPFRNSKLLKKSIPTTVTAEKPPISVATKTTFENASNTSEVNRESKRDQATINQECDLVSVSPISGNVANYFEVNNSTPDGDSSAQNDSKQSKNEMNTENPLSRDLEEEAEFAEFRQKIMAQLYMNHNKSNDNMRRFMNANNPNLKDPTYLEKRKKNNEAAKKSRDARKLKEDEIAIKCAFMEQMNLKLKLQFIEIEKEKKMLSSHYGRLKI